MKKLAYLTLLFSAIVVLAQPTFAQTQYQWNGTTDSNWQTSSNWLASPGEPTPNTTLANSRLNVSNGTGSALNYTAAEGTTTFASTLGTRALVISNGQMNITGGTFVSTGAGSQDVLGNGGGASGVLTVNGGNYINGTGVSLALSGASTGTLNVVSGTATINNILSLSGSSLGTATVNLNGGSLLANSVTTAGGSSTFNFNGGTLQAGSSTTTFLTGLTTANVRNGGAVIDTNGKNVTIGQALVHSTVGGDNATDGGLAKNGTGVLTVTGVNTYTGITTVNAGTLATGATGALGVSDVSVGSAILTLGNSASIGDSSTLTFTSLSTINLSFTGTEVLGALFDSSTSVSLAAGTYTSTALNTFFSVSIFSGTGSLSVVPEPSVWLLLLGGMSVLIVGQKRRRVGVVA